MLNYSIYCLGTLRVEFLTWNPLKNFWRGTLCLLCLIQSTGTSTSLLERTPSELRTILLFEISLIWFKYLTTASDMVFFSRPNKIKLRWIKFSSRPCVPLFLANVNRGNWNVIQILIYFLQPICYGRKEKNIWKITINLSTFNHRPMKVKNCPGKSFDFSQSNP